MKKTLFAAAIFAAASVNSFGAACTTFNGSSLSSLSSCEIGNGGTLWTLSNFTMFANTLNGFGVPDMTANNLEVYFLELPNGFEVSYWNSVGFFEFTGTQANAWGNGMWITPIGAVSPANTITDVTASYLADLTGDLNFTFRKNIQNQLGAGLGTVLATFGSGTSNVNNATTSGSFGGGLSVNDRVFFDAAGRSGGTIGWYTNTFTTNNIPEPMSFLLMGAGLVGIAALRRRSS